MIIQQTLVEELRLDPAELLVIETEWGEVPMVQTDGDLAVSWRCDGRVLWVARVEESGLTWLDSDELEEDLSFAAVQARILGAS